MEGLLAPNFWALKFFSIIFSLCFFMFRGFVSLYDLFPFWVSIKGRNVSFVWVDIVIFGFSLVLLTLVDSLKGHFLDICFLWLGRHGNFGRLGMFRILRKIIECLGYFSKPYKVLGSFQKSIGLVFGGLPPQLSFFLCCVVVLRIFSL